MFSSSAQYLFRLDDVCPTMNWRRFEQLSALFDRAQVRPILGVVPDNQDPKLQVNPPHPHFWPMVKARQQAGWIIAQHGYQHRYETRDGGLLGLRMRSEFAGLPYEVQLAKIAAGKKILADQLGQPATWWTAPAHSFDATTCRVLRDLHFTHISDGIALFPFKREGLLWVPHQLWKPAWRPFGVWTIGLHLNTMSDRLFEQLARFLRENTGQCRNVSLEPRHHPLTELYRYSWYAKFQIQKHVWH